ncbi:MAG: hypothetical protein PVH54_07250 [Gammaproteobacteria bacterium]|jgi:hypothetical protein
MDSYIVRIYRRSQGDSDELAGLVETVGTSERLAFRNFSELASVLHRMLEHNGNDALVRQQQSGTEAEPDRLNLNLVAGLKG